MKDRQPCIHGNLCRAIYKLTGGIYFEELLNIMDSLTAEEFDNKSMEIQDKYDKKHIVIM